MDYEKLADLYERLEKVSGKYEKRNLIVSFLKEVPPKSLRDTIYLLLGRVFPKWGEKELGIAEKLALRAISIASGIERSKIEEMWKKLGDLGSAAEWAISNKRQVTLFVQKLTVEKVVENLRKIAELEGEGVIDKKVSLLAELLTYSKPKEARYVIRTALKQLRVGVAEGMVRDAIAKAFFPKFLGAYQICPKCYLDWPLAAGKCGLCGAPLLGDDISVNLKNVMKGGFRIIVDPKWKEVVEEYENAVIDEVKSFDDLVEKYDIREFQFIAPPDRETALKLDEELINTVELAYDILNDMGEVARIAREEGIKGLRNVRLEPGRPIRPMLAHKAESIKDAFEAVGRPASIEYKYDGFRIQIHKKGNKIWLFTRRLEEVTRQFPDVVEYVKEAVKAKDVILDSEAVGVDPKTGKFLPFQRISKRIRRKYDIYEMMKEIPVTVYVFDIMYLNGETLISKPYRERLKILEKVLKPIKGKIEFAHRIITDSDEEASKFYQEAISKGLEGLMFKNLNEVYKPGQRVGTWMKLKPIMETLDLVIIGAEWGEGKRARQFGSFILACREPYTGRYLTVGKMGTGMTEEELFELTERLKPLIIKEEGKTVWFKPELVVEVAYEEIQESPKYESGFALRFPRLVRIRDDRSPEEIDTLDRIKRLFLEQRGGKR